MKKRILFMTFMALSLWLCGVSAIAETRANTSVFEEIIVTAEKREMNIQKIPVSVTALSDIQIEDANVQDILALTGFIPNVSMKTNLVENIIVIRGVSSFHTSLASPAGLYVDDVPYPHNYMHDPELYDIKRIEVLKGPQGTLYGRNSESGVVNIITQQPGEQFMGKVFADYGSYNTIRIGIDASGPLVSDKLYFGISLRSKSSDGYITNIFDDNDKVAEIDHKNGRASLCWTPMDALEVSLIGDFMKNKDQYGVYRFLKDTTAGWHEINQDTTDQPYDQTGNGQTLRIKYRGDVFDFLSVSGTNYYENEYSTDFDQSSMAGGVFNSSIDSRVFSQEFRLSSPGEEMAFQWLVGLYGFKDTSNTKLDFENLFGPGTGSAWKPETEIDTKGGAVFGQVTYSFFKGLRLTGGLRFDHQALEGRLSNKKTLLAGGAGTLSFKKNLDYNEILPKVSLAYDFTDSIMTYATVSKGYLTGGYNWAVVMSDEGFTYDPEYSWNYEIGTKSSWCNNKLISNISFFYMDTSDKQVSELDPYGLSPMATRTVNAAKTHSLGFEVDMQAKLVKGLEAFAGFGYVNAKIDEWVATEFDWNNMQPVTNNYKDKYLPYVPKYTYNLSLQYRHDTGLFGRVDLLGTGSCYSDTKNINKRDAYELVNLRAGYENEHFDIVLWCQNLFDKEYMLGPGIQASIDGAPRTIGIALTGRF